REAGSSRLLAPARKAGVRLVDAQRAAPLEARAEPGELRVQLEARDAERADRVRRALRVPVAARDREAGDPVEPGATWPDRERAVRPQQRAQSFRARRRRR